MDSNDPVNEDPWFRRRTVHPREVWIGVSIALVGMVVTGVIMVSSKQELAWIGAVIIVIGAAFAWWHGVMADIHGGRTSRAEIDSVREGSRYDGVLPADRETDEAAEEESRQADAAASVARVRTETGRRLTWPERARTAAAAIVLAALWLLVTVVTFNQDPSTHDAALRQLCFGVVLALLALRLQVVAATTGAAGLVVAASVIFLFTVARWWPHHAWIGISGLVGGILALGAGLVIIGANLVAARTADDD
jgi:hypothetical protein